MKRVFAGAFLILAILALPAVAQRGMSAGHGGAGRGFGAGAFAGHGFAGRGGFVGGAVAGRGFGPRAGVFIGHPHGSIVIRTTPFPHGHFHHGHHFFPGSFCFQSPFLCQGRFGFDPFFAGGWSGSWAGGYALPYVATYPDTYNDQVQATLAQQQQMIADLEEQVRQEHLNRMQADAAQPAPEPLPVPPSEASQPITPTVLVFRDRHRLEIRNYAIVGETLYEFAPQWTRKISLADLDLPATIRVNDERDVKFRLPSSRAQVITRP